MDSPRKRGNPSNSERDDRGDQKKKRHQEKSEQQSKGSSSSKRNAPSNQQAAPPGLVSAAASSGSKASSEPPPPINTDPQSAARPVFYCATCGQQFQKPQSRDRHILRKHVSREKYNFPCVECSKKFPNADALRSHARSHTSERPFSCPVEDCPKRFKTKTECERHKNKHEKAIADGIERGTRKFPQQWGPQHREKPGE